MASTSIGALAIVGAGPGNMARAADVNITTSTSDGVNLDSFSGTTAQVFSGVTINNTTGLNCGFGTICAGTQAWTLTNQGTIAPLSFADGVHFNAGGTVINSGTINGGQNAIWIEGGTSGNVTNLAGATINGAIVIQSATGMVTNAGTMTSGFQTLGMTGGVFTNLAGGVVEGHGGGNAVAMVDTSGITTCTLATCIVINSGIIRNTDGGFATGVSLQDGTLTNNTGGQILGSYNAVWANGSSATSITNHGYLEASMTQGGGAAIEVDAGGTVVNTGTINSFTTNGSTTDAGIRFSGAGSVTNSGTIESTTGGRSIAFSGAATHTLNLDTGSVLVGNVQGGTGTDNLVLLGIGTESIAKFLSFETLSMQGTEWNLTGTGAFTTSMAVESGRLHVSGALTSSTVTVQGGLLDVNGTLTSPAVTVNTGGTLGGTGTIVGAVTVNGIIAPGNSIGTLNITGPYTQATGSTYTPEVNTTTSDLINVTGTATIQGGTTVSVLVTPGFYTLGHRYTILTASGGVTGQYTTLTDNAPFVDFQLASNPNNIFLDVSLSGVPFQQVAQTRNQIASAGGLQGLGAGNPLFDAAIMLDTPNALRAFDLVSGEIHASITGTLLDESHFIRDAVIGRLRQSMGGAASVFAPRFATLNYAEDGSDADALAYAGDQRARDPTTRVLKPGVAPASAGRIFTAWGQTFGNWGGTSSDGNAASLSRTTGGFFTGLDTTLRDAGANAWRFGLAGGYQHTAVSVSDRSSSGGIGSSHLAVYGGTQQDSFGARFGAAYGWNDISTTRSVVFPGFSDATHATYTARTTQVFGELGYGLTRHGMAIEPFAGLAYVAVHTSNFTEAGGAAALTGFGGDADATFSTLGLRVAMPLFWISKVDLVAKGSVAWRHAFGAVTPTAQVAFASTGTPFVIAGVPIARDAAAIELSLDGRLAPNATIGVTYTGQLASGSHDHGIKGNFVQRF